MVERIPLSLLGVVEEADYLLIIDAIDGDAPAGSYPTACR